MVVVKRVGVCMVMSMVMSMSNNKTSYMKRIMMMVALVLSGVLAYGQGGTIPEQVAREKDTVDALITNKTVLDKVKARDEGRAMKRMLDVVKNVNDSVRLSNAALTLDAVLANGTNTTRFMNFRSAGAPTKNMVQISTGIVRVQDTNGAYSVTMQSGLDGSAALPYVRWLTPSSSNNLYGNSSSSGVNNTLPSSSGVLALVTDIPRMVQLVTDGDGVGNTYNFTIDDGYSMCVATSNNSNCEVANCSISGTTLTIRTVTAAAAGTDNVVFNVLYK